MGLENLKSAFSNIESKLPTPEKQGVGVNPSISTSDPGLHMFRVGRDSPIFKPPRNCASTLKGNSWFKSIEFGDWECNMTPLFLIDQEGAPFRCEPKNLYSKLRW